MTPITSKRYRFFPNSFKFTVADGDKSNGNANCNPQETLKKKVLSKIKIQLRDHRVAVYLNGEQVCAADREDRASYKNAIVYASNPCVRGLVFQCVICGFCVFACTSIACWVQQASCCGFLCPQNTHTHTHTFATPFKRLKIALFALIFSVCYTWNCAGGSNQPTH